MKLLKLNPIKLWLLIGTHGQEGSAAMSSQVIIQMKIKIDSPTSKNIC